jgi:surface antigen
MGGRWTPMGLLAASMLAGCSAVPRTGGTAGTSTALECAPFARQVSGIQLFGEAYSWWDQAAGRYGRGTAPVPGGVLVFRRSARLPSGHVSVVDRVVSAREIVVTQANWVHHRITRSEPVIDVSAGNDWSAVRVWWAPAGLLGTTVYPAYGFIAPGDRGSGLIAEGGRP